MKLLSDIRNVVEGYYNKLNQETLEPFIQEQILLRAYLCKPCLNNGKCTHCGCKTPHMFYSPNKVDSLNKWGTFMTQVQWEALKNNIDSYAEFFKTLKDDK